MDERVDAGIEQNLEDSFGVTIDAEPVAEQKTGLDALTDKIGADKTPDRVNPETGEITPGTPILPAEPDPIPLAPIVPQHPAEGAPAPTRPAGRARAAMPSAGDIFDGQKREPGQEG
jgi:hypothetical protein